MKKIIFCIILALLSTFTFSQEKIAVYPFEIINNAITADEAYQLYDVFTNHFTKVNFGKLDIVNRSEVDKLIFPEHDFQLTKFSAEKKTADMMQVENATQVLSGKVGKVVNSINITVSLYTYPKLVQLPNGADLRVANVNELFENIPVLVQKMQASIIRDGGNPPPPGKIYKIGDTGPAGGIVFFDRGFTGDGWRYLEAAPAGSEITAQWGAYDKDIANTMTAVSFGKQNTKIIVDRLRRLGETNRAAQLCAVLDINGYKDWFLPSKDELDLMYKNLKQKGLGGFSNSWYWSSSQYSGNYTWGQRFSNGSQGYDDAHYTDNKQLTYSVRAVRAF